MSFRTKFVIFWSLGPLFFGGLDSILYSDIRSSRNIHILEDLSEQRRRRGRTLEIDLIRFLSATCSSSLIEFYGIPAEIDLHRMQIDNTNHLPPRTAYFWFLPIHNSNYFNKFYKKSEISNIDSLMVKDHLWHHPSCKYIYLPDTLQLHC